ncbi:hypothetical protein JTE90_004326 [Oedothorax gibbosus]|uniref:Ubiquitin carboxyl-terminal hydrolase n=1 Tax=Oedothorax gibbosus TaxID=931172 RepID=A0AAV6VMK8_9ARAC|nr:hypothetical protein JTE90_004326 [Oedothorax gibbosus]
MNKFLDHLGISKEWRISDIPSFSDELIGLVPTPVLAVLLLFPFSNKDNQYCKEREENSKMKCEAPKNLYFMSQTINKICGTVALIHAIANNADKLNDSMAPDSLIKKFIDSSKPLTPIKKGKALESSEEIATTLLQCQTRDLGDKCDYHFVAFVQMDCKLFELDGRKLEPVFHGNTSEASFLKDTGHICQEYMLRDPHNLNFTALAFGAA